MNNIINQLKELEKISEELEPSETAREEYLKEIKNYTNGFINKLEYQKSYNATKVEESELSITESKKTIQEVIQHYNAEVATKGISAASGGHIGYIPGGGIYTSAIADFLAAVTNEYAGMSYGSPGAVAIENELINWMKGVFSYPKNAVGNLTSGGSIANLVALTAARDRYQIKGEVITKSVIYMSTQVHHCVNKAIRIIGLEDIIIRPLTLDHFFRIDVALLEDQINKDVENGLNPFMVIASAGTTDTGAIDPLKPIGELAKNNKMWFHIDAAYGGFFILTKEKKELFKGVELSDSLVIDPHKGMFLPYGLGAVLVKDKEAVFHSHHYTANYMQDATSGNLQVNPADVSPELTKHFRGLRMWLPMQLHGLKPFVACLQEKLLLTIYFRNRLEQNGFMIGPTPDLTVSYFWYPTKIVKENLFNEKLMEFIHKDGRFFLSSTKINNQFVIRMAILSFRTKRKTIDKTMDMIIDCLILTNKHFNKI